MSDHAPTAEEQLPAMQGASETIYDALQRNHAQLLAALRENREKDARIAELESYKLNADHALNLGILDSQELQDRLRAVSDALDETERADAYCPACGNSRVEGHVTNCIDNDWVLTEPDAIFARIRAIVEGKDSVPSSPQPPR